MNSNVAALAFDPSGNLYAGGSFSIAGTNVSYRVAKLLLSPSSANWSLASVGAGTNVISAIGPDTITCSTLPPI